MSTKPLFLVLLCVNLLGRSQKEPSKETTIKVSVRRVPVDVIVTDSKGHPVRDLKVSDFQVFEDAKPREITGFSLEESATAQTTKVPLQPGLLANYTDATAATTDLTVILLDELNTAIGDAAYARFRLEKMLVDPTLKQETVALFVLNRELIKLQDFTQDP